MRSSRFLLSQPAGGPANRERQMGRKTRTALAWAVVAWAAMPAGALAQKKADGPYDENCIICRTKKRLDESIPWLRLGADLRLRLYYNNTVRLDKSHHPTHEQLWQRHRARVWASVRPIEDLELNVRLMGEPRYWCSPDTKDSFTHCEALIDQLNIRWRNAFDLPLTLTVGRQDFKFGEGWLLRDGVPLDGGRSTFFDAARATLSVKDIHTTFDLIYVYNHADSAWFHRPINDQDLDFAEHDEQGAIFYVSNQSVKGHTFDGYFIYKHTDRVIARGWDSDLYTFGLRAKGSLSANWKYRGELAPQFGHKNGTDVCALGFNGELAYHFNDAWKNVLRAQYEYRSGDDDQDGAFDILWGRWYQGSNLWHFYLAPLETLMAAPSNYHRVALGWGCTPLKSFRVDLDYHLLFRDENPFAGTPGFSRNGCFRGQLITVLLRHKFNEHIQGHLMVDLFFPGDYYSDRNNDVALFTKLQIVFTW